MTKSPEQKAIEKQMRAQEKAERAAQIRERASGIVAGAHQENGFRILDFESETMLAEILRQYDGNENNTIGSYLFDSDAPRKVAHWEEIIRELVRLQYIELVSSQKGTKIYKISQKGYEYADSLKIGKR